MYFEWDRTQEAANWSKHQVEFTASARVFSDENYILIKDRVIEVEQRWHAIGQVQVSENSAEGESVLLVVVHSYKETIDGEEVVRIISARQADKRERRLYRDQTLE